MKKEKNIYLTLTGNYGNQLFHLMFAKKLLKEYGFDNIFTCFETYYGNKIKKISNYPIIDKKTYFQSMNYIQRLLYRLGHSGRRILKYSPFCFDNIHFINFRLWFYGLFGIIEYRRLPYKNIKISKHHKKLFVRGYFESRYYFEDQIKSIDIANMLFDDATTIKHRDIYSFIKKLDNSVCVTIRRGCFLDDRYSKDFNVCGYEYFKKAIDTMSTRVNNPYFFFFSDDISWAKKEFSWLKNSFFEKDGDTVEEKLYLMSACKHFILSNSTFSWWSWYLSNKKYDQVVITPETWKASSHDVHLIEDNWIRISKDYIINNEK